MATVSRTTYGRGGFDPTKPNGNVIDVGTVDVPDQPAGVPAALVAIRNRLTNQGVQPTDRQTIDALCVLVGRVALATLIDGA